MYFTVGGSGEGLVPANVTIFDVAGRKVRDLIRGEFKPGIYGAQWNGVRNDGSRVKAGVYFVRMRVNHQVYGTSRSIVWPPGR